MKLDGVKVLDLSLFLPGPHLTMMMADHGAEVIAVEPPTGEPNRDIGIKANGASVWFRNTHRGKKSICLDLKVDADREAFLALCRSADVIVEAFRPGVVDRLGVGYEAVRAVNPAIIYCSISAYGQTGPKRLKPAHDLSVEADSGIVSLNLGPDGTPAMPGIPAADMASSLMAFGGILMALYRRTQMGVGDYIDIAMQDSLIAWLPNALGPLFGEGRAPDVAQERSWGGSAMYQIYCTADDRFVTLGGSEAKFARNLLEALGRPDLIPPATQPPGPAHDPVKAFLRYTFRTRTQAEWDTWFEGRNICYAPVRNLAEAFAEPHLAERGMLLTDDSGNKHLGIPIRFRNEPGRVDPRLPDLGEHNRACLDSVAGAREVHQQDRS